MLDEDLCLKRDIFAAHSRDILLIQASLKGSRVSDASRRRRDAPLCP